MSKIDKSIDELREIPNDFRWSELVKIMTHYGFKQLQGSGSRVKFYHSEKDSLVHLHAPHGADFVNQCSLKDLVTKLTNDGFLDEK